IIRRHAFVRNMFFPRDVWQYAKLTGAVDNFTVGVVTTDDGEMTIFRSSDHHKGVKQCMIILDRVDVTHREELRGCGHFISAFAKKKIKIYSPRNYGDGPLDVEVSLHFLALEFCQRRHGSGVVDHPAVDLPATFAYEVAKLDLRQDGRFCAVKTHDGRNAE